MKRITLKGLADYMTAGHARQRTILKQFKFPKEHEAQAKIVYYKEVRECIVAFHRSKRPASWLASQAALLEGQAATATGRARARLRHNARALRAYEKHFAVRMFDIQRRSTLALSFGDVLVSVVPDLTVVEAGQQKLVRLELGEGEPSSQMVKILSQGLFEAADRAGLRLPASGIVVLDVPRGREHRGARAGARMRKEIEAACQTISAVWDTL